MIQIYIGAGILYLGIIIMVGGITNQLDTKMENNTNMSMRLRTMNFGKGFVDDDGKKIKPFKVLEFYENEEIKQ